MAAPFDREPGATKRAGGDVLALWAERTGRRRAGVQGRGGLRFAFYGRVSTEDWQDPVTSAAAASSFVRAAVIFFCAAGMSLVFLAAGYATPPLTRVNHLPRNGGRRPQRITSALAGFEGPGQSVPHRGNRWLPAGTATVGWRGGADPACVIRAHPYQFDHGQAHKAAAVARWVEGGRW
jgi:hypothetical protein